MMDRPTRCQGGCVVPRVHPLQHSGHPSPGISLSPAGPKRRATVRRALTEITGLAFLPPEHITVVGFGGPEDGRWLEFGHNVTGIKVAQPLLSVQRPLRRLRLLGRMRVDAVPILRAAVIPNTVELRGIGNRAEELGAQRLVADDFGIEDELSGLSVATETRADLLVVWRVARALRVAHAGRNDARHALEVQFRPPEAAAGKGR